MSTQSNFDPSADFDAGETSGRESMYSPASSYSTYSREVKYIFEPQAAEEESQEEYPDYSHIGPRTVTAKEQAPNPHQNHQHQQLSNSRNNNIQFLAHTPRTLSAASSHCSDGVAAANKENRTPNSQYQYHLNNRLSNFRHELPSTEEDSIFENSPSPSSCQAFQYSPHKHHFRSNNGASQPCHQSTLYSPRERGSYDRGPISPGMEEALYSSTSTFTGHPENGGKPSPYGGVHPRKNSAVSDQSYFSPSARNGTLHLNCRSSPDRNCNENAAHDVASPSDRHHSHYYNQQQQHPNFMAFSKHAYPAIYRSSFSGGASYYNANSRARGQPQHQRHDQTGPLSPRERFASARINDIADVAKKEKVFPAQLFSSHQQYHYPHHAHPSSQQPLGSYHHNNSNHGQQPRLPQPPYPQPPRYDYQAHRRRKTWSPPIMKLGPLAASSSAIADAALSFEGNANINIPNGVSSEHRPFYSNDSLLDYLAAEDGSRAQVEQRKAQSLSEDLDVTPPRLAPISGVLAQKPGPNLIKPIACKPGQNGSPTRSHSPSGNTPHRGSSDTDSKSSGSQFPRTHPHQPPLSTWLQGAVKQGVNGEPQSPNGADDSNNLSRGSGAFGKLTSDTSFRNEARVTSFVAPGPSTSNVFNNTSSQNSQALPSPGTTQNVDNTSIYRNIAPMGTAAQQGQQQQSPGDPNTSYSSFSGEFPQSDNVCAAQTPPSNTVSAPSLQQQYQSQQQQRVAGETNMLQTPSPSDSGVGEHEAILREKDAEINTLREVMDRNERAIFQVYEERRHVWLNDTRKLQDEYERKLKVQSRKSYKTEQVLSLQVYKLQQEQKSLQEDKVKVTQELDALKQRLEEEQAEVSKLKRQLGLASPTVKTTTLLLSTETGMASPERTDSNVAQSSPASPGNDQSPAEVEQPSQSVRSEDSTQSLQREILLKNKELIQLRNKLACSEADLTKANRDLNEKAREITSCNDKVKSLQDELCRIKNPPQLAETGTQTHAVTSQVVTTENLQRPSLLGKQERTIDELQEEALSLRTQIEELKTHQEEERKQWLDEKNKVVRYQKQLQLNYVQMQRKNTTLETEVQQLTLELENRDMKLTALSGEESVC